MTLSVSTIPVTASGIACAKCSHWENGRKITVHHASVAAVRLCHQKNSATPSTVMDGNVINDAWATAKTTSAAREAEQERAAYEAKMRRDEELSLGQTLNALDEYIVQQRQANPWPSTTELIKPGFYAIEVDGTVKFYKVDKPTQGRWAGRTFVSVQASDELYPVRNPTARQEILVQIARDPKAAMLLYGQKIERCGHCGRTLTNEESRAVGIGPICRGKMGW